MPINKLTVLKAARFGERVAEDETQDLSTYFVETDQWRRLYGGNIDVVYGTKGAGKSALYSLLISRKNELFDKNIFLIAAENPRGQPAFSNLIVDPPPTERHFIALWKLYLASLLHSVLAEYGINNVPAKELAEALEREGLIKGEATLAALLKGVGDYVKRIFSPKEIGADIKVDPLTGMPIGIGGKIVFSEPSVAEAKENFRSVDNLLALANDALFISKYQTWVLLDRLDVAFSENQELEVNALRALFRVYLDAMAYENFKIKIFLRTDIWARITDGGFREASHITRHTTIEWGKSALLNLIVKRAIHNESIRQYYDVETTIGSSSVDNQEAFFYRMCPEQIDVGSKQPRTIDWLLTRTQDGQKINAPREMVHLLNSIRDVQVRSLELGDSKPDGENLFARLSFKDALPEVSKVRLEQTIYAENPFLKSYIEKLKGEKTQQSPETLSHIWGNSQVEATGLANELVKVGFFEPRGDKITPSYWVPFFVPRCSGFGSRRCRMTANGQQATTKEKVSTYLYFSSLYFVTVGVLYLWGYWTTFEVNILEYLSLADIVKSTAYPIASTFIFFVIGAIHGHVAAIRSDLPPSGGQNTPIGKFLDKHFTILVKLYIMGTILLLIFGPNKKWLILPVLFSIPLSLLAKRSGLLESLIPDSSSRTTVIFLLVALPIFSFGHGRLKAANVLDGKDYQYVASRIDGITLSDDTDPDQRLRFLGHAGDFLFLLHPSKNTLIIMKFEQAKILQIKEFKVTRQPIFSWDSLMSLLR